jgi:hypothetical protein
MLWHMCIEEKHTIFIDHWILLATNIRQAQIMLDAHASLNPQSNKQESSETLHTSYYADSE